MSLDDYGWDGRFWKEVPGEPARVLSAGGGWYRLMTATGERRATLAGRLRHGTDTAPGARTRGAGESGPPVVGDWVIVEAPEPADPRGGARIEAVLPRRTKLSRKVPGRRTVEQVVAANVDAALLMMGLDEDFSLRRLERLLTIVAEGGARPAVLLNKSDLCGDAGTLCGEARRAAPGVAVLTLSCRLDDGLDAVRALLRPRETATLIGSSGVGKSTLINRLLGSGVQATREVRAHDGTGRHTTTRRELFRLPGGALLIDNPGIREVQLWAGEGSLDRAFTDVETLAAGCRFRDCGHDAEPGCAVRQAIECGRLDAARLDSFHALRAEMRSLAARRDAAEGRELKRRWKIIHKAMRRSGKWKR